MRWGLEGVEIWRHSLPPPLFFAKLKIKNKHAKLGQSFSWPNPLPMHTMMQWNYRYRIIESVATGILTPNLPH